MYTTLGDSGGNSNFILDVVDIEKHVVTGVNTCARHHGDYDEISECYRFLILWSQYR